MNRYKKLLAENEKHIEKLNSAFRKIEELGFSFPLKEEDLKTLLNSSLGSMALDQIAYRFSKLQDSLGKLLRAYLYSLGENVEHLPMIDVINLACKYNVPIDEKKWFELRAVRNAISHEYEDNPLKIANVINLIFEEKNYLSKLLKTLERRKK